MKLQRFWTRFVVAAVGMLVVASVATAASGAPDGGIAVDDGAHDTHQHGASDGHLPASRTSNIELVSKLKLKNVVPEKVADVGVLNGYAYLAAWGVVTCKYNGVHVVDVRDPRKPKEVAFIGSKEGSYPGEGVQALHISTPAFTGDILVTNNEKCKEPAGFGGMNIYDISKPSSPTPLAEGVGDSSVPGSGKKDAHEIHSVFAWDAGSKAYAVIVDNEESVDVDIIDITDPKKPSLIAEYDLAEEFPQILQAAPSNLIEVFLHDMVVKEIDGTQVMLLSYWDGGYVALDMTEPLAPQYLGDTDFTDPDSEAAESGLDVAPEGNAHQAEFTLDNQFVVAADEDFDPYKVVASNVDDSTEFAAAVGSDVPGVPVGDSIDGDTVYVGLACGAVLPATGPDQIAVAERGVCDFQVKYDNVVAAGGYEALIVFNREQGAADGCDTLINMLMTGDTLPAFFVARRVGFDFFDAPYVHATCIAGDGTQTAPVTVGTVGDSVSLESIFDGWGYVHLFENTGGKMTELDTYAIPEAHNPAFASGFGDLSVHEAATSQKRNDLVYFSYYSGGFRVVEIDGGELNEVGHFIDEGGSNFWGVEVFQSGGIEYVAASDRDYGLYIFRYTGS